MSAGFCFGHGDDLRVSKRSSVKIETRIATGPPVNGDTAAHAFAAAIIHDQQVIARCDLIRSVIAEERFLTPIEAILRPHKDARAEKRSRIEAEITTLQEQLRVLEV